MKVILVLSAICLILAVFIFFLVKAYKKKDKLYKSSLEIISDLEKKIFLLNKEKEIENKAEKEAKSEKEKLDNLSDIDRYNAINAKLSNSSSTN